MSAVIAKQQNLKSSCFIEHAYPKKNWDAHEWSLIWYSREIKQRSRRKKSKRSTQRDAWHVRHIQTYPTCQWHMGTPATQTIGLPDSSCFLGPFFLFWRIKWSGAHFSGKMSGAPPSWKFSEYRREQKKSESHTHTVCCCDKASRGLPDNALHVPLHCPVKGDSYCISVLLPFYRQLVGIKPTQLPPQKRCLCLQVLGSFSCGIYFGRTECSITVIHYYLYFAA